jgi:ATPase subunit of ABC transporter with duplicated ATPase domains
MLTKMYVNNYRCLVNFEIEFGSSMLLLGTNGSGKTSIFDILFCIRRLVVDNAKVYEVFSTDDLTVWVDSQEQVFELHVDGNGGSYVYRLVVMHQKELGKLRIERETLSYDGKPLFSFEQGEIHLFNDHFGLGPTFTFDWHLSGLSMVAPRHDNTKLIWFKKWIEMLFIVNLYPKNISAVSEEESSWLNREGTNFVSWYRYISQEHQDRIFDIITYLRESIPGFDSIKLETAGKHRVLKVGFKNSEKRSKTYFFDLSQLSDGQRVLLILHMLLVSLKDMGHTLMLDEPENYVALAEIQPWLMELSDACGVSIPQIIIISHHPELIDYFGVDKCRLIDREPLSATRVKAISTQPDENLKLSEIIARGWEHE